MKRFLVGAVALAVLFGAGGAEARRKRLRTRTHAAPSSAVTQGTTSPPTGATATTKGSTPAPAPSAPSSPSTPATPAAAPFATAPSATIDVFAPATKAATPATPTHTTPAKPTHTTPPPPPPPSPPPAAPKIAAASPCVPLSSHFKSHVAPILPTLSIGGDTDGSTRFHVGFDVLFALTTCWDLAISPTFSTDTDDGISTLFSFTDANATRGSPWSLGLSLTFTHLGLQPDELPTPDSELAAAKREAVAACRAECTGKPTEWCKEHDASENPVSISPEDLCDAGRDTWKDRYDRRHREERGRFPAWAISAGFSFGSSRHKWLEPGGAAASVLVPNAGNKFEYRLAASATWISPTKLAFTVEVPVTVKSAWTDGDEISWCTPAGMVSRDGTPTGMTDAAQICSKGYSGAPTQSTRVRMAAYFGWVKKPDGLWRIALGPTLSLLNTGGTNYWALGAEVPFYFNFANGPEGYTGDFKFLVKLTPAFTVAPTSTGFERRIGLTLELSAARTLFPRALQWL